jgi:UTP--glucose-1-phosphate uridylyltransferase
LDTIRAIRGISDSLTFSYTRQETPLGLGHAVLCAKKIVGDSPFAVLLGDDIIEARTPAILQLLRVFGERGSCVVGVQRVARKLARNYGVVEGRPIAPRTYLVTDLVEKPSEPKSNLAIIGRYVFTPDIFGAIEKTRPKKNGEIQLTDAIRILLGTRKVYAREIEGARYDAGCPAGWLRTNIEFGLKKKEIRKELKKFPKGFKI